MTLFETRMMPVPAQSVDAIYAVIQERKRQEEAKASGKFTYTCADVEMTDSERFLVLGEEFGEVARGVLESHGGLVREAGSLLRLRAELVQVATVAVAWIEGIDKQHTYSAVAVLDQETTNE